MSSLEFQQLDVRFGSGRGAVHAVTGVDLLVPSGAMMGLVGESGSGKSTIARAAVGLHEPSDGRILLDGVDVAHARGKDAIRRQRIQMVFQDPYSCLDPRMTIGASIDEALAVTDRRARREGSASGRSTAADRRERTADLLRLVHLDPDRAGSLPGGLSGGQRQRVAIARALAAEPDVLLADEITSALDVSVQGSVLNLLSEIRERLALTVLFISHNLAVVRQLCDTVAVMRDGRIVEQGPVLQVLERPEHDYTRELISAVPRLGVPLFTPEGTNA